MVKWKIAYRLPIDLVSGEEDQCLFSKDGKRDPLARYDSGSHYDLEICKMSFSGQN